MVCELNTVLETYLDGHHYDDQTRYPGKDTFEDELPDIMFKNGTDEAIIDMMVKKLNEVMEKPFCFYAVDTDKFSR